MSYFVTGTDTNVGKTFISCALLHAYAAQGKRVIGMKPVAAGREQSGQQGDVERLKSASNVQATRSLINPYFFASAVAPHLAAQQERVEIDLKQITEAYTTLAALADVVIVEGVGGFLVPLNATEDSADLAARLGLPVILVVGIRLGCLNHALLTVQAIAARGLTLAGWVANCTEERMAMCAGNIASLQHRISAPLIGKADFHEQPDARQEAANLNLTCLNRIDARP